MSGLQGRFRHRRLSSLSATIQNSARDPVLLVPADVPQLPQRQIEFGPQRHSEIRQGSRVSLEGGQCVGAAGGQRPRKRFSRPCPGLDRRSR